MGVMTTWELCLFQVGPFCLTLEVVNGDIWFLDRKRLEPIENSYYGNNSKGVICFFCDPSTFMVPSFKNTALIFPEILFIQFLQTFQLQYYGIITDLICIIEKRQYLKMKKDISRWKMPFLCILKGLSNKQIKFCVIYTLTHARVTMH